MLVLTTIKIIKELFSIKTYSIKAFQSYEKSYEFAWEVLWIPTQSS